MFAFAQLRWCRARPTHAPRLESRAAVPARTSHAFPLAHAARELGPKPDDRGIKVLNVVAFGVVAMIADVRFATRAACWLHARGAPLGLLAVSDAD
jgi:hypothetical protein